MRRFATLVCLLPAACATVPAADRTWPGDLPPRAYFDRVWEADDRNRELQTRDQYLDWVVGFYAGSPLVAGWSRREADLAASLPADEARLLEPRLRGLGQVLSSEWAKDNRARRVTSEMLALWGRVLAQAQGQDLLRNALEAVAADVDGLLRGGLDPASITRERYAEVLAARP